MNEKIEIMGISLDTCSVEEVIESINVHWLQEESLSTYGSQWTFMLSITS